MTIAEQVKIMETQLASFETLVDKMMYLTMFFGNDPEFVQEAMDVVRSNICKTIR